MWVINRILHNVSKSNALQFKKKTVKKTVIKRLIKAQMNSIFTKSKLSASQKIQDVSSNIKSI